MDNKEALLNILKSSGAAFISSKFNTYDYLNISEKDKAKLLNVDPVFDVDNFVIVYCLFPFGSIINGLIFTLFGVYFFDGFTRKYVNYTDIKFMTVKEFKNNKPEMATLIICTDGDEFKLSSISYNKIILKSLLERIMSMSTEWLNVKHLERPSGTVKKGVPLDTEKKVKCHAIIHAAASAAGGVGAGIAQIPLSDNVVIAPIQIGMIVSLGAVFGIKVTNTMAKGIATTFAAGYIGRGVSQVLLGWVPVLGNAVNMTTAAGITEAVGWVAVKHFEDIHRQTKQNDKISGILEGLELASKEYEGKYKEQIDLFLHQQKIYRGDREKFIALIEDYEQFVFELNINPELHASKNSEAFIGDMNDKLKELKGLEMEKESDDDSSQ
jgi:uncharacterized protein (DUF697 family)